MFWGFGCDIFGRKWGFNLTLGITAVFGMFAASSPNFVAPGCFAALWSFGVGGNLPVGTSVKLLDVPDIVCDEEMRRNGLKSRFGHFPRIFTRIPRLPSHRPLRLLGLRSTLRNPRRMASTRNHDLCSRRRYLPSIREYGLAVFRHHNGRSRSHHVPHSIRCIFDIRIS
jgi:hypothetical protein